MKQELLITEEAIQTAVRNIAALITSDYYDENPVIICVLKGATFFFSDLCKQIKSPFQIDFIRPSSYGSSMTSNGFIKFTKDVEIDIKNKDVIIVEDIIDSGLTTNHIIRRLKRDKPKSIKVCVLVNKLERREYDINIDYRGFNIEKGFIVGYGLDYNEDYRGLNNIYILKEE